MASYDPIVQWLLYQEDSHKIPGLIVHLNDGAGMTRLGITSKNFGAFVPANFFTNMPFRAAVSVARSVYQEHYWKLFQGDLMPELVAAPILSASVNIAGGVSRAVKILQDVLGETEDGVVGPKTLTALASKDPVAVAKLYRIGWDGFYRNLVIVNPSKQEFLDGWISRVNFPYPSSKVPAGLYGA